MFKNVGSSLFLRAKSPAFISSFLGVALSVIIGLLTVPTSLGSPTVSPIDTPAHVNMIAELLKGENGFFTFLHLDTIEGYYPPFFHLLSAIFVVVLGISIPTALYLSTFTLSYVLFPIGVLFLWQVINKLFSLANYKRDISRNSNSLHKDSNELKNSLRGNIILFILPALSVSTIYFPGELLYYTRFAYLAGIAVAPLLIGAILRLQYLLVIKKANLKNVTISVILILIAFICEILSQPRCLIIVLIILVPLFIMTLFIVNNRNQKLFKIEIILTLIIALLTTLLGVFYFTKKSANLILIRNLYDRNSETSVNLIPNDSGFEILNFLTFGSLKAQNIFTIGFEILMIILCIVLGKKIFKNKIFIATLVIYSALLAIICSNYINSLPTNFIGAIFHYCFERITCGEAIILPIGFASIIVAFDEKFGFNKLLSKLNINLKLKTMIIFFTITLLILSINLQASIYVKSYLEAQTALESEERGQFLNEPRLNFMQEVENNTPNNALIISNPWNGSIFLESVFNRRSLFRWLNNYGVYGELQPINFAFPFSETFKYYAINHNKDEQNTVKKLTNETCAFSDTIKMTPYILQLGYFILPPNLSSSSLEQSKFYNIFDDTTMINNLQNYGLITEVIKDDLHGYSLFKINC